MTSIICVGACYLDIILTVPHFPDEDSKLRATSLTKRRGGNCPNTLEVLSQLVSADAKCNAHLLFLGTLPEPRSQATRTITESLQNVDFSNCIYRAECTEAASSYIIKNEAKGSRTIVNYNELPEMTVDEFVAAAEVVGKRDDGGKDVWWHFEGRIPETSLACIKYLRSTYPHAKVSVEVEKPGRPGLQELASEADVVFFSRSWAEAQGHTSPHSFLQEQATKLTNHNPVLFCTWGADGATVCHHGTVESAKPRSVAKVVDPVGAGDTFIAGVLFVMALHSDKGMQMALQLGVAIACEKVSREGFQGLQDIIKDNLIFDLDFPKT